METHSGRPNYTSGCESCRWKLSATKREGGRRMTNSDFDKHSLSTLLHNYRICRDLVEVVYFPVWPLRLSGSSGLG